MLSIKKNNPNLSVYCGSDEEVKRMEHEGAKKNVLPTELNCSFDSMHGELNAESRSLSESGAPRFNQVLLLGG